MNQSTSGSADTDDNEEGRNIPVEEGKRISRENYIFSYGRALEPKFSNPSIAGYYRPWRFFDKKRSGVSCVFYARSREFRIALDVSQFAYENVVVKLVGDQIVVEAHHPDTSDYLGRISRQLVRKYKTPPDLKLDTIAGKHKRGFLILWAERNFELADKPEVQLMENQDQNSEEQIEPDRTIVERNASIIEELKENTSVEHQLHDPMDSQLNSSPTIEQSTSTGAKSDTQLDRTISRSSDEQVGIPVRRSSSLEHDQILE